MRNFVCSGAALVFLAGAVPVSAQTAVGAQLPGAPSCPSGALSVYFASGETKASPETEQLLGRIRATASECQPDRIDLVAHIDTEAEGGRALALSLERVRLIAGELVQAGLPAERIRVAAMPAAEREEASSLHQIDVVFQKQEAAATDVSRPVHTQAAHLNEI